ncbi:MAPEG family protein [Aliiroseovarius sp. YM-037]|uniref:MAPEG family protein n=1 Tax=Aliiroseovarius sp. YM-037 TaxID=3341728 RepID=UPI003A7F8470
MPDDAILPITACTALLAGVLYVALTFSVILKRRGDGVVLGDGGDRAMQKRIRGHANAAEQIPLFLIILGLAEMNAAPTIMLIGLALTFGLGRLMHASYFGIHGLHWRLRFYGMLLTMLAQIGALLALALALLT